MKNKYFLFAIIAFFALIVALLGCTYFNFLQDDYGNYFSFTTVQLLDGYKLEASIYEYNLQNSKISEVYRFPVSAMYSLGIYDKAANSVFMSRSKIMIPLKECVWEIKSICTT